MTVITEAAIERAARNILRANGVSWIEMDREWEADVARYREMCAKFPDYAATVRSELADAFRSARASLTAARPSSHSEAERLREERDAAELRLKVYEETDAKVNAEFLAISDKRCKALEEALTELTNYIKFHKASVLDGMTKREMNALMDVLHRSNTALRPSQGEK